MNQITWGPFTGSQLTIIIVAVVVAIMPGSLWAVANYQRVAIQDPQSGKKSEIDKQRRLRVYDAQLAADERPDNFVRVIAAADTTCLAIATPPAGKALVVKSVNVDVTALPNPPGEYVGLYVGASCSTAVTYVDPATIGANQLNFEPGLVVPNGQSLWVRKNSPEVFAFVSALGYLVPKSWVPAALSLNSEAAPATRD